MISKNPKLFYTIAFFCLTVLSLSSFGQKVTPNQTLIGDYQTADKTTFAKVYKTSAGDYKVSLVKDLTSRETPIALLTGNQSGDNTIKLSGEGCNGVIEKGRLTFEKGSQKLELVHFYRISPTMNALPPKGAIVLFNGKNLDALAKVNEKEWLEGSGPVDNWKILPGNILEAQAHTAGLYESVVSKQKFGDLKLHLEFRLLGTVTNGGVYFMSRYEVNIKDAYSQANGATPIAFGNITKPAGEPQINNAFAPLEWQTLDIDFKAPRFDATGKKKTENARITVVHNGITIYNDVALEEVKGSTAKLGEAAIGPLYFQEHGSAYQFRNIWVVDKTLKGTETFQTDVVATDTVKAEGNSIKKGGGKSGGNKKGGRKYALANAAGASTTDTTHTNNTAIKKGGNKAGGRKGLGKKYGSASPTNLSDSTSVVAATDTIIKKKGGKKGGSKKTKATSSTGTEEQTNNIAKYTGGKSVEAAYEAEMNPAYATTTVVLEEDKSGKPAKPSGFIHPGILINHTQLEEIKKRVASGTEPQKSAFAQLKNSPLGALDYKASAVEIVSCGPHSTPDLGCKVEQSDCAAAYSQALLWVITGNKVYASNAIQIMNTWSTTLKGGHNYANGPVQAAWCGSVWPRAAEIIRYTNAGWSESDIAAFQNMLRTQYLPTIIHGDCENGNKELAMSEALINIGVFNDDRAVFDLGLKMWRGRTPAYIYLKTDGPRPIDPPGCGPAIWSNKGLTPSLVDGLLQESARDYHHPGYAFASMVDCAETAFQQGIDLYGEQGTRIMAALEFQAQYLKPNNAPIPANLEFGLEPTWEIAYNHFHNRLGNALPKMTAVIPTNRPTGVDHHMEWETLTHGGMGNL